MGERHSFLRSGCAPVDEPHRELHRCLCLLGDAVRSGGAEVSRARYRTLGASLGEHFSEEEALMRSGGWSQAARHAESHERLLLNRFEALLGGRGITPGFTSWALDGLPEMLRYHTARSDFGFAVFARGVARDPGSSLAMRR